MRLLAPYVVFEFIGVLLQAIFIPQWSFNLLDILGNIIMASCYIGPDWFLFTLFYAEILQYGTTKYVPRKWHILVILASFALAVFLPELNWMFSNFRRIFAALSFLLIGMNGKHFFQRSSVLLFVLSAAGLLIGAAINTGTPSINLRLFENPLLFVLCGVCGAYATIFISKQLAKRAIFSKFLISCGKASLVIMSSHYMVLLVCTILYGNWTSFFVKLALFVLIAVIEFPVIMLCRKVLPSWVGEKGKPVTVANHKKKSEPAIVWKK